MPIQTPIHLLDGGLGTLLVDKYNCEFNDSTPLWSSQLLITSPSTLLQAQTGFANAGADVILTATYQASHEGVLASGVESGKEGTVLRSAVKIARDAFDESGRKGTVALGLGAYGATMVPSQEYSGRYDGDHVTAVQLRDWHFRRIAEFLPAAGEKSWGNVDFVAFETLPLVVEIRGVRMAMGKANEVLAREKEERKGFWIACVFPGEGNRLPDGSSVEEVVRAMLEPRDGEAVPMGIGINCTRVGKLKGLVREFEDAMVKMSENGEVQEAPALVVYPDGTMGEVYNTTTKVWEKGAVVEDVGSWHEAVYEIVCDARKRGVWREIYVGGCCKTTPDDIANLRKLIDGV